MKVGLENNYHNLNSNPQILQSLNLGSNIENKGINLEDEKKIYNINIDNISQSFASEFGFRTDQNGFFEKDLNKVANIPQNYDINIKSVRMLAKELSGGKDYNGIDLPAILNKYHNALSPLNQAFNDTNKSFFNPSELAKMTQGFSTKNGEIDGEIAQIYDTNLLKIAQESKTSLNTLNLDNKIINYAFEKTTSNTSQNQLLKPYLNKDGSVSKGALLLNFAYEDARQNNEPNFFMKPAKLDFHSQNDFYKIMRGEIGAEEFLRKQNEQEMSFDLYLHINGADKRVLSDEKLGIFFQQYLNYEKNLELKDFANSSSIFNEYISQTTLNLESLKSSFNALNLKSEELDSINEARQKELNDFSIRREKQTKFQSIINSYFSVMG